MSIFKLPDLGEGLPDAEIVKWHVKEGDEIKIDAPLVSMETAKAVVDVPSPLEGKILKLYGRVGDIIATGAPLVEFRNYKDTGTVAGKIEEGNTILEEKPTFIIKAAGQIRATPAVRALAKSLEVCLEYVTPTGTDNTVTMQDVQLAAQQAKSLSEYTKLTGARRTMAEVMAKSHTEVAAVTVYEDVILSNFSQAIDISVSIMLALVAACKLEPNLNGWYYPPTKALKLCTNIDLGIAIDTSDGLFVPVIRDLASKSAIDLRTELNVLKQQVATRSIPAESLRGASISLSNFGKFAGRYANPMVVPPQVAILGIGRLREEPIALNGSVTLGKVLPLSLTFDHRACTGGEAARFLDGVIKFLQAL